MSSPSGVLASGTPTLDTPSYMQVLRLPRAARLFGFALVGRLSYGTVFLSLTLALTRATGSYAVTGACIAMFGLASAVLVPVRAALIDRYGMRRALPPMAALYASLLTMIAITIAAMHTSGAGSLPRSTMLVLFLLSMSAGATVPPLGPSMRTLWARLATSLEIRRRAFALDTVCEQVLFLVGPLLAGALATWATPLAGVALSAILVLTDTLALAFALPPQGIGAAEPEVPSESSQRAHKRARLRIDVLGGAVPASLAAGTSLSALSLLIVAFAQRHHHMAVVAWAEAGMSAGSACGGLAFGALKWRASHRRQMSMLLAITGAFIVAAGSAGSIAVLIPLVCVLGLFESPMVTTAYVVADESARPGRQVRAGALVNGAYNLGSATGSAAIGLLLGGCGLRVCFLLAGTPALAVALLTAGRTRFSKK